jgi:CHAD domain-containing protein
VEMKKLRSIVKFLRVVYPKQKLKKAAHLLRYIFHDAGKIREYQLLQQWLQKNELANIEEVYFHKGNLQFMIEEFRKNADKYKTDIKEVIVQVENYIEKTNEILQEQYVVSLKAKLEKTCNKSLPSEEWHELRKVIKQWMYAINWIGMEDGEESDNNFSYYNKLQEVIGQWHDLEMIKEAFVAKQIYLSKNIEVQKDFSKGWEILNASFEKKRKIVEDMLSKQEVQV